MHAFITNLPSLSAYSIIMRENKSCQGTRKLEAHRSKNQERFWASWFLKGGEVVKIKIHFVKERRGKGLKERSILRYCRSKGSSFVKFKDLWTSKCNISVNKLCQNTKLGSLSQIIFAGNVGFRKDSWTVFSCTVLGKWFPNTGNSFCSDKSNFLQSDSQFPRTATSTLSVTTPCHLHLPLFELAEVLLRLE